ncbi:MAG: ACT domain-containing protein [Deltaproteobacteria bacterium]|nr:ACT domain-containing protein [Deltaproteobacteria bacterium]
MKRYAVTAIGRDTPGIVAAVTKALYEHGANIEDSSMTRLEDEFAIILIMTIDKKAGIKPLLKDLKQVESSLGLAIHVKEIEKRPTPTIGQEESSHIIIIHGADKAGIVYKTTSLLAGMGVNITDLETKILSKGDQPAYIMVLEVFIPKEIQFKTVEDSLKNLGEKLDVAIKIKPVEAYEPL